jgi:hypothetical protein
MNKFKAAGILHHAIRSMMLFGLSFIAVINVNANEITVDEIVSKANLAAYYAGSDGRSDARMKIVDSQGRTQVRQFVILRKDIEEGGAQNMLVVFSRPADVRGTAFLVNKHPDSDDNRWLYLPGLDLVKRISAGDKRTSFVGSHYFYEDVSGRSPNLDTHTLIKQDDQYFYLKHTPKQPEEVEFAYYTTKIDKHTFLPMLIEYFDSNDKPLRTVEVLKTQEVMGYPTVTESKIIDHQTKGYTLMQFAFMKYDLGIPDSVFTERSLRNPPQEWLERK